MSDQPSVPSITHGASPVPPAVEICDVWKSYRTGSLRGRTLVREFESLWARLMGKEDPNSLILDRTSVTSETAHRNRRFWAVQGASFSVAKGEVVALLGRNGAGKSTVLQILSGITEADKGIIRLRGRVASLLGAGVGFNEEMTGRENVYLNGSILGMQPREIASRMESIAEFAEIPEFMDTPVKRYSTGMKARLGFSVAVHLSTDIMILDEVFATGDRIFRMKGINKMKELASSGRTIIIVTHMPSLLKGLCERGIVMRQGSVVFDGAIDEAVQLYMEKPASGDSPSAEPLAEGVRDGSFHLFDENRMPSDVFESDGFFGVCIEFTAMEDFQNVRASVEVRTKTQGLLSRIAPTRRQLGKVLSGQRVRMVFEMKSLPFESQNQDYVATAQVYEKKPDGAHNLLKESCRFVVDNGGKDVKKHPVVCQGAWNVDLDPS